MKTVKPLITLTRWKEYYGKVIFITLLGTFLVPALPFWKILLLLSANLLSGAFTFMINDVEDAEDDALDAKKQKRNPISAKRMSKRTAMIATFAVGLTSLMFYSFLNLRVFIYGSVGLLLGFLYSYKRIRLKSKPVIDLTSHGIFLALVYFLTAISSGDTLPSIYHILWLGIPIYFLSVLGDISNEIRDYTVDRKAGLQNTASFINLQYFHHLLTYGGFMLIASVFVYMIVYTSMTTKAILGIGALVIAVHYYLKWYRKRKALSYYPYSQEVLTLMGFLLFLNP
ncbi:MAG TPA: UbiA family prenyltransferase [Patescibacteria group bacterium]|nr:UbiA family prenyltransferase [Patescibacteria group bacterium]